MTAQAVDLVAEVVLQGFQVLQVVLHLDCVIVSETPVTEDVAAASGHLSKRTLSGQPRTHEGIGQADSGNPGEVRKTSSIQFYIGFILLNIRQK